MDPGPIFTIDTSSTVTCLLAANHYLPHHTFNPLLQQTGELGNLTDSLGQSLHVACKTCVMFPSSYWFDNLGFLLRENFLLCFFIPCSWDSQQAPHKLCKPLIVQGRLYVPLKFLVNAS